MHEKERMKGDVTRDGLQRRFLTQLIISTLLQNCFECFQHCSNISALCCAKNRRCESSRLCYTGRFATTIFNATHHFNIVAKLFRMFSTLFQHFSAVLRKNRRCESSRLCYTGDLQRRFSTQHIISTLLQHCSNIATLLWAKNPSCESSRGTSP